MKKYIIELTEKQARLLSWALDTLPRLIEGQCFTLQELMESAWAKRCKEATGKMMDEEFEGGWHKMREDAETFCKEIRRRFWDLSPIVNYSVHYDDTADILWDIYQCLRFELWKNQPEPKSHFAVDALPAHKFGTEPLCKVTSKEVDNKVLEKWWME